jgi:ATP-dependent Clp protease ATP-binding subunit ClpA
MNLLKSIYGEMELEQRFHDAPSMKEVVQAVKSTYHPPSYVMEPSQALPVLKHLEEVMDDEIIGHKKVKATTHSLSMQVMAGMQDSEGPAAKVLMAGMKGTGKTLFPQVLSGPLERPVTIIEMSRYAAGKTADEFLGEVASALRKNAFSIIVPDELEKAPLSIQNALLGLMNKGEFTFTENGAVVKVSAKNAMIYATTNAGQEYLRKVRHEGIAYDEEAFKRAMVKDGLSEFLVDRYHTVIPVDAPTREEFSHVLKLKLKKFQSELAQKQNLHISIGNEGEFISDLTQTHYSPDKSGRDVNRIVQNAVRHSLAQAKLEGKIQAGKPAVLHYVKSAGMDFSGCLKTVLRDEL